MSPAAAGVLERAADEAAIAAVVSRYAFALDDRDYDLVRTCFTSDADCHYTRVRGDPSVLIDYFKRVLADVAICMHFIGRQSIEWTPDGPRSRTYALALYAPAAETGLPTANRIVGVTYEDRFARTEDGWRISARRARSLMQFAGVPVA